MLASDQAEAGVVPISAAGRLPQPMRCVSTVRLKAYPPALV